jgi:hypothetical protein
MGIHLVKAASAFQRAPRRGVALIAFSLHATHGVANWHIKTAKKYKKTIDLEQSIYSRKMV